MRNRRKVLMSLLAGIVLLASLLAFNLHQSSGQMGAREKLDNLLGPSDNGEDAPPMAAPESQDFPPNGFETQQPPPNQEEDPLAPPAITGGSFFGMPMPLSGAGVDVQELGDRYVLRIPLADPQDATSVKLNVSPHRIEVSGQTGSKENGASVNSSFMQSFTTAQEVNPDKITRRTEKNGENTELVITIPKKAAGSSENEPGDEETSGKNGDDSSQQDDELMPPPPANPQNDPGNPFNGIENKVI